MLVKVFIEPHERGDAIEAYRNHLTAEQVEEIRDADEECRIMLLMGGGPTRIEVERQPEEYDEPCHGPQDTTCPACGLGLVE